MSFTSYVCDNLLRMDMIKKKPPPELQIESNDKAKQKIPVLRVTQPYLNLLVKPRIFFQVFSKEYNFMHFERRNTF